MGPWGSSWLSFEQGGLLRQCLVLSGSSQSSTRLRPEIITLGPDYALLSIMTSCSVWDAFRYRRITVMSVITILLLWKSLSKSMITYDPTPHMGHTVTSGSHARKKGGLNTLAPDPSPLLSKDYYWWSIYISIHNSMRVFVPPLTVFRCAWHDGVWQDEHFVHFRLLFCYCLVSQGCHCHNALSQCNPSIHQSSLGCSPVSEHARV